MDEDKTHGFDVDPVRTHRRHAETILAGLKPPAGRAGLTNAQRIELAGVHATLALAEALDVQNALSALRVGVPALEHDDGTSADPKTTRRVSTRNRLRQRIREGLGL